MHVLVVTIVHDPDDARIRFREIPALLAAGHQVSYAAPFTAYGRTPPEGVTPIDLPRSSGRRRLGAVRAARRVIAASSSDVVLVHDPELVLALIGRSGASVWDVHEDTAAAVGMKAWLPGPARRAAASAVRVMERRAERRLTLLLAEHAYAERFRQPHPVVTNDVFVPAETTPVGGERVIYVGRLTRARGALDLIDVGRALPAPLRLELVGPADSEIAPALQQAAEQGWLTWHGPLPNDRALALVDGSLAGLSLLHDQANYLVSQPTKVVEYMARGVPVVTTPLPLARGLVERHDCGVVVPYADPAAVVAALVTLAADPQAAQAMGNRGHAAALAEHDWAKTAQVFVKALETAAARPSR